MAIVWSKCKTSAQAEAKFETEVFAYYNDYCCPAAVLGCAWPAPSGDRPRHGGSKVPCIFLSLETLGGPTGGIFTVTSRPGLGHFACKQLVVQLRFDTDLGDDFQQFITLSIAVSYNPEMGPEIPILTYPIHKKSTTTELLYNNNKFIYLHLHEMTTEEGKQVPGMSTWQAGKTTQKYVHIQWSLHLKIAR